MTDDEALQILEHLRDSQCVYIDYDAGSEDEAPRWRKSKLGEMTIRIDGTFTREQLLVILHFEKYGNQAINVR